MLELCLQSMPRYIAFLRAVNVGRRIVTMERLRIVFQQLGLAKVETFIASGNVIFKSRVRAEILEAKLEKHLHQMLGYEVATFIRSDLELAAIAGHKPFPASAVAVAGSTLFVGFLRSEPSVEAQKRLRDRKSAIDDFRFHRRELFWLCRTRLSDSEFSGGRIEKLLGMRTTMRNVNTVKRLTTKYPAAPRFG